MFLTGIAVLLGGILLASRAKHRPLPAPAPAPSPAPLPPRPRRVLQRLARKPVVRVPSTTVTLPRVAPAPPMRVPAPAVRVVPAPPTKPTKPIVVPTPPPRVVRVVRVPKPPPVVRPVMKRKKVLVPKPPMVVEPAPPPRPPRPVAPQPPVPEPVVAPAPQPVPQPEPEPSPKPAPVLRKREAAERLYYLVGQLLHSKRYGELGTGANPNQQIARLQAAMGLIEADGIYGPKTRARGKELTGMEFPVRLRAAPTAPPVPTPTAPQPPAPEPPIPSEKLTTRDSKFEAAEKLYAHIESGGARGFKRRPSEDVREAQKTMGGGLVPDGIYGPKTRARGAELLGKPFPPR